MNRRNTDPGPSGIRPAITNRIRAAAIVVLAGAMAFTATSASAYMTAEGTGTGAARTASNPFVIVSNVVADGPLEYPGATAGASLDLTNPGSWPVRVNELVAQITMDDAHLLCGGYRFAADLTGWTVPAGTTVHVWLPAGTMTLDSNANDACQGSTATYELKAQ